MNKKEELQYARVFVKWLNEQRGFDYSVHPNLEESRKDTEIDVYAWGGRDLPPLGLQISNSEDEAMKDGLTSEEWILRRIRIKESRYSQEAKRSLILLIKKDIEPVVDERSLKRSFRELVSDFKGIYVVHLPLFDGFLHEPRIITIKEPIWHGHTAKNTE